MGSGVCRWVPSIVRDAILAAEDKNFFTHSGVDYSTYGSKGITIAVRIGFDDNRSLGPKETGGRVALPVFKEITLRVYHKGIAGPVPEFPAQMEQNINNYLKSESVKDASLPESGQNRINLSRQL